MSKLMNLWHRLRCLLGFHRWETVRDGSEKGVECRWCHDREFAHDPTPIESIGPIVGPGP